MFKMFDAILEDVSILRDSIATISEIIDEAEFLLSPEGVRMIAADRAVVAVVDFNLSAAVFKQYNCDKSSRIGINMEKFLQVLKRALPNDALQIKLEKEYLEIILIGDSVRKFTLPLIDISREETPPVDKLEFPVTFKIKSEILNNAVEDAELIGDSIVFSIQKDNITFFAKSDINSTETKLDPKAIIFNDIKENARARYATDYLKKMLKARKLSEDVSISLANDYPLKMVFEIPGKLSLGFILAPRVED